MRSREFESIVTGQKNCTEGISELMKLVKSLRVTLPCITSQQEELAAREKTTPTAAFKKEESTLASNPFAESKSSGIAAEEDLEVPPSEHESGLHPEVRVSALYGTAGGEKKQMDALLEEERNKVAELRGENDRLAEQMRKLMATKGGAAEVSHMKVPSTGTTESDMCHIRRRSFAKNLGIAWENMQMLKETSAHLYSQFDQYIAQM